MVPRWRPIAGMVRQNNQTGALRDANDDHGIERFAVRTRASAIAPSAQAVGRADATVADRHSPGRRPLAGTVSANRRRWVFGRRYRRSQLAPRIAAAGSRHASLADAAQFAELVRSPRLFQRTLLPARHLPRARDAAPSRRSVCRR